MAQTTTLADRSAPILETHDYPRRWQDYVGQDRAKKMLRVAAKSAKTRKQPLDHVLITHPSPGVGKTALAVLLATELRRNCRVVSGTMFRDKARVIFASLEDGDLLFYDEFHPLMDQGRKNAEWMLSYLQDGVIMGPLGPEPQPRITIIAATTDPTERERLETFWLRLLASYEAACDAERAPLERQTA